MIGENKMKKIISFLIALTLILQVGILSIPVNAASSSVANLEVSTENVFAGDAVYVTVSLTSNPGLTYVKLKVSYDTNALTLFGVQNGEIINDLTRGNSYVWSATETTTATGTFATLIFFVSEDASAGTYPVTITCVEAYNNESNVYVNIQNGSVIVNAEECVHDMESISYKAPTCETTGFRVLKCTKCDYSETVTFDEIDCEAENEADCINDAECKYCGDVLELAYGHKYRTQVIESAPTEEGYTLYTCMRCGDSYQDNVLPPDDNPDIVPVTGITLSESDVALNVGDTKIVQFDVKPENATDCSVVWTVSDPSVVEIHESTDKKYINIVAISNGTATITGTTTDGGFVAQCVVVVGEKTIVGYKWYANTLRHKVLYSDGTYDMEDCAPVDCICGRQYNNPNPPTPPTSDTTATIVVDSKEAASGGSVKVKIKLTDNPGLTSIVLKVSYDQSLLTLTNVEYNASMGGQMVPPASLTDPVTLYWVNGFENCYENGDFATLTFNVSKSAKVGDVANVLVTYNADDVFSINDENVNLDITDGKITVIDYVPGDINGDGVLNNKDVTRFMQYNAGWDVEVNIAALDVNGDGVVNNKDVTRLMQYNAGWDVEIY